MEVARGSAGGHLRPSVLSSWGACLRVWHRAMALGSSPCPRAPPPLPAAAHLPPGIFVALILRYDVQRNFRSKYFRSAFGGYVAGLIATIVVMNVFKVRAEERWCRPWRHGFWGGGDCPKAIQGVPKPMVG